MVREHTGSDTAARGAGLSPAYRTWAHEAVRTIERDFQRSADTHLIPVTLPATPNVHLYLKDEATHPTGSLKHRLARSLFLYGLCNGWIGEGTTIVELSSGNTAVSEAYFARLLGLPFVAVVPRGTSAAKLALIEFYGGRCHVVDGTADLSAEATRLARDCGGHFMDQFTYAERATDWRGNNNIAESIFEQLRREEHPVPRWIVAGAGTGGTAATLGRYIRYRGYATELCVVDPEDSVFFDYYRTRDPTLWCDRASAIEGIGRPRVVPSFIPEVVDRMLRVPDAASIAALRLLEQLVSRKYGGSTGTTIHGALYLAHEMAAVGESGSIVALAGDGGDRYLDTYYDDGWLRAHGYDVTPHLTNLDRFARTARWDEPAPPSCRGPESDGAHPRDVDPHR